MLVAHGDKVRAARATIDGDTGLRLKRLNGRRDIIGHEADFADREDVIDRKWRIAGVGQRVARDQFEDIARWVVEVHRMSVPVFEVERVCAVLPGRDRCPRGEPRSGLVELVLGDVEGDVIDAAPTCGRGMEDQAPPIVSNLQGLRRGVQYGESEDATIEVVLGGKVGSQQFKLMAQIHSFRERLVGGELLVGTMVTLAAPAVAEILAAVGFDWLFIDAEHSALGTHEIQGLLQGAEATALIL